MAEKKSEKKSPYKDGEPVDSNGDESTNGEPGQITPSTAQGAEPDFEPEDTPTPGTAQGEESETE